MSELEPVTPENSTQPAKRGQKEKPKKTLKREIFEWVVTIAAAVLIAFVIRTFLFEPVRWTAAPCWKPYRTGKSCLSPSMIT